MYVMSTQEKIIFDSIGIMGFLLTCLATAILAFILSKFGGNVNYAIAFLVVGLPTFVFVPMSMYTDKLKRRYGADYVCS